MATSCPHLGLHHLPAQCQSLSWKLQVLRKLLLTAPPYFPLVGRHFVAVCIMLSLGELDEVPLSSGTPGDEPSSDQDFHQVKVGL